MRTIGNLIWFILAGDALAPIGKTVVYSEFAQAARRANADARVASMRW